MLLQKYRVMLPTVLASVAIILTVGFAVLFGNIKLSTVLLRATISGILFTGFGMALVKIFEPHIVKYLEALKPENTDEQMELQDQQNTVTGNQVNIISEADEQDFQPLSAGDFENINVKEK